MWNRAPRVPDFVGMLMGSSSRGTRCSAQIESRAAASTRCSKGRGGAAGTAQRTQRLLAAEGRPSRNGRYL